MAEHLPSMIKVLGAIPSTVATTYSFQSLVKH